MVKFLIFGAITLLLGYISYDVKNPKLAWLLTGLFLVFAAIWGYSLLA